MGNRQAPLLTPCVTHLLRLLLTLREAWVKEACSNKEQGMQALLETVLHMIKKLPAALKSVSWHAGLSSAGW